MISGGDRFTYIGYTHGGKNSGARPTLYFKEGRYTQDHEEFTNRGWHATKPGVKYACGNVSEAVLSNIKTQTNINAFMSGGLRSNDVTGVHLFECYQNGKGEIISTHTSRGRLIKVGDPDFDMQFNDAYAKKVLRDGCYALNSIASIKEEVKQQRKAAQKK
jgi:hypothetical protein